MLVSFRIRLRFPIVCFRLVPTHNLTISFPEWRVLLLGLERIGPLLWHSPAWVGELAHPDLRDRLGGARQVKSSQIKSKSCPVKADLRDPFGVARRGGLRLVVERAVEPTVKKSREEDDRRAASWRHLEAELRKGSETALAHVVQVDEDSRDTLAAPPEEELGVAVAHISAVEVPL